MSVFIIAEAGINHNGSIKIAKKLIDVASKSGADAVKFQTFKTEQLILNDVKKAPYQQRTTKSSESQMDMLKKLEISNTSKIKTENMSHLIDESNEILSDLSWDNKRGREYLQKEFNVTTRAELDEKQLILFVENLKSIRNHYLSE